jgi:tetratricopeptide (TPR) repeat protein
MVRDGLCALLCAGIALGIQPSSIHAGDPEKQLRQQLGVQAALEQALELLQRGNHEQAVRILESRISHIDGNRRYLNTLRDAYRGYILDLKRQGDNDRLDTYLRRLALLDPDWRPPLETPANPHREQPRSRLTPPGRLATRTASTPPGQGRPTHLPPPVPKEKDDVKRPVLAPPGEVIRAQGEEEPRTASNSGASPRASELLQQAARLFQNKNYADAGKLYERVHHLFPASLRPCHDQWAYCILYRVVEALNHPEQTALDCQSMEREVRHALSLAPKLDPFGQQLLERIREQRQDAGDLAVAVQHLQPINSWSVTQTTNFRILHHLSREEAEKVARIAEGTRARMSRKWFGQEPKPWSPRCDIYLHANADAYTRATQAPRASPGHSTFQIEGGRVLARRIDLRLDNDHALEAVLPHEATHVVLAGRFGRHDIPRWADEGMAVLSEPRERIDRHLVTLPQHRQAGHLFKIEQLFRLTDYPQPRYVGGFYAQSVSVVDFLVQQKGPRRFAHFLRDGLDGGYEQALQRHYGYHNCEELERQWIAHAFHSPRSPLSVAEGAR